MSLENADEQQRFASFFQPKTLSTFANLANVFAWLNLVVAILYMIVSIFTLDNQIAQNNFADFSFYMEGHWWEWRNLTSQAVLSSVFPVVMSIVSMAGNFVLFKSVSIGLNILLEIGFTMLPADEEAENE